MKVRELEQTCSACPSQWEFRTFENRPVYVRYRWGYLSIRIGSPDCDIEDAVGGKEIFGDQLGEDLDGSIGWNKVGEIVESLPNSIDGYDIEEDGDEVQRV